MNSKTLLFPVLFPALAALLIHIFRFKTRKIRNVFIELAVIFNSFLLILLIYNHNDIKILTLFRLSEGAAFAFKLDGLGIVFCALIALLWPLTALYAFEYMYRENQHKNSDIFSDTSFFCWFVLTFGVVAGIALSANLLTLYFFYEVMTLTTLPLVMHGMDGRARYAGRKYLIYSVGGAALAFIALAFSLFQGGGGNFALGGTLGVWPNRPSNMFLAAYLLGFIGFGVKAAVFPFHGWLPSASVAPTPVTALLHAVAVVKAGIFAIIRLTWYVFEPEALAGTWVHTVVFIITCVTILYGSSMALFTQHLKRRFAYSTISQLSYILMGVLLLTPDGLIGALTHMTAHAVIKINLFFCAGAILCMTEREYLFDMRGIAVGMPKTFVALIISGLALCGLPPMAGFIGKWQLGIAAVRPADTVFNLGHLGLAVLAVSSVLTVLYVFSIFSIGIMPGRNFDFKTANRGVADPGLDILIPMAVLALIAILYGAFSGALIKFFSQIADGVI